MRKSIEHYAPRWAVHRIIKRACTTCGTRFSRSDISQIGIKKIKDTTEKNGFKEVLAIETMCSNCGKYFTTTFGYHKDLRQLLCTLLEEIQKTDHIEHSREIEQENFKKKSKISDKEVSDFMKRLDNIVAYEDLLKELGVENLPNDDD